MKNLLTFTAVIEGGTGLLLVSVLLFVASLLLGSSLDGSVSITVARLAGLALLSLTVACWLARPDGEKRAATMMVSAMVLYNFGAAALLVHAVTVLSLWHCPLACDPSSCGHDGLVHYESAQNAISPVVSNRIRTGERVPSGSWGKQEVTGFGATSG